jgi:hypothetical protein
MIYEFTLVLDREPSQAEIETLAAAGLDPIGARGPAPGLGAPGHRRRHDRCPPSVP